MLRFGISGDFIGRELDLFEVAGSAATGRAVPSFCWPSRKFARQGRGNGRRHGNHGAAIA